MNERESLEAALEENVWDEQLHRVYADWLDEYTDESELANEHRLWTKEWQEAKDWLSEFAKNSNDVDYETDEMSSVSLEDVVEAGRKFVETGEGSVVGHQGFGATNQFVPDFTPGMMGTGGDWEDAKYESDMIETYWKHRQNYTRVKLDEPPTTEPFRCCY